MKLIFIVPCTSRKRGSVHESTQLRAIPGQDQRSRFESWWNAIAFTNAMQTKTKASDLYCGTSWCIIRQARRAAQLKYSEVETWICSAGLGLIPYDRPIVPYSATFAPGQPDSVWHKSDQEDRRASTPGWWAKLCEAGLAYAPTSIDQLSERSPEAWFVVVASMSYLEAIGEDLLAARENLVDPRNLLIVSSGAKQRGPLADNILVQDSRHKAMLGNLRCTWNAKSALIVMSEVV